MDTVVAVRGQFRLVRKSDKPEYIGYGPVCVGGVAAAARFSTLDNGLSWLQRASVPTAPLPA
jgi:hypothetical protein